MSDDLLTKKAAAVCAKLESSPHFKAIFGDDPAPPSPHPFLDLIREILQQLLPAILGCFATPASVHKQMQNPGPLTRARAKKIIRKELGADDEDTLTVREVQRAVFSVARDTTLDEYKKLVA